MLVVIVKTVMIVGLVEALRVVDRVVVLIMSSGDGNSGDGDGDGGG